MSKQRTTHITPAGLTGWTCLNKPSTKFKADGEYSVELLLTPEEAQPLVDLLKPLAEEAKAEEIKKNVKVKQYNLAVPGTPEVDKEGNETGKLSFKFKQAAIVRPKGKEAFEPKIGLFDAKGKPLPASTRIGRNSKVKVAFETFGYANASNKSVGVALRLKAVQVLDLVEFGGGGSAESYGFGEEDGYTAPEGQPEGEQQGGEAPASGGDF